MQSQVSFGSFDSKKHLMVAYDDINAGRKIEFEFIKDGLSKKEFSIYLFHGDVKQIEKSMQDFGIAVSYYKKTGLLKVGYIGNPAEDTLDFIDSIRAKIHEFLPDPKIRFRLVGRAIPDVGTETAMAIQSRWEEILHNAIFDKLNGSILCTYDLSQIKVNGEWTRWLKELQKNHHEYIISHNGKSVLVINR